MTRIEKCPCGSGRAKDQCCDAKRSKNRGRLLVVWSLLGLAAISITALGLSLATNQQDATPAPTAGAVSSSVVPAAPVQTGPTNLNAPYFGTPVPFQYDAPNNRYWDPSHSHWHGGPPPLNQTLGASATPISVVQQTNGAATTISTRNPTDGLTSIVPPSNPRGNLNSRGEVPQPWEYEAADNTHFEPVHGHWHQGPPPPDQVAAWKAANGGG